MSASPLSLDTEAQLIELLAWIYKSVPWRSIRVRNPHDVFNNRVRAAAHRGTLYGFVAKLCNHLGLQTLYHKTNPLIESLRAHEGAVLNALNKEHIPFCVQAIAKAKELHFESHKDREDQTPLPLLQGVEP